MHSLLVAQSGCCPFLFYWTWLPRCCRVLFELASWGVAFPGPELSVVLTIVTKDRKPQATLLELHGTAIWSIVP